MNKDFNNLKSLLSILKNKKETFSYIWKNKHNKDEIINKITENELAPLNVNLPAKWKEIFKLIIREIIEYTIDYALTREEVVFNLGEAIKFYFQQSEIITKLQEEISHNFPLKPRKQFLIDALNAHKRKEFTLSVPALLLQIEGIIKEIPPPPRVVAVNSSGGYPNSSPNTHITGVYITLSIPVKNNPILNKNALEIIYYIDEITKEKRQKILSGETISYATIEESTELVLLFAGLLKSLTTT